MTEPVQQVSYQSIPLPNEDAPDDIRKREWDSIASALKKDGVVVVTGAFSKRECDDSVESIVSSMERLGSGVSRTELETTWEDGNRLPPQTRPGLFQTLVGCFRAPWEIRTHKNVARTFYALYARLRGERAVRKGLVVTHDGINLRPPGLGPFYTEDPDKDWPHLDQTKSSNVFDCIQGQVVLTNTTAAFRCTPGSHHAYPAIIRRICPADKKSSNFLTLKNSKDDIHDILSNDCGFDDLDQRWQIPIRVPPGSIILWLSSLIHSACTQAEPDLARRLTPDGLGDTPTPTDPWRGWRCVVYVSLRAETPDAVLQRLDKCTRENRLTNHTGTRLFAVRPGGRYLYTRDKEAARHERIRAYLSDPTLVHAAIGFDPVAENKSHCIPRPGVV